MNWYDLKNSTFARLTTNDKVVIILSVDETTCTVRVYRTQKILRVTHEKLKPFGA